MARLLRPAATAIVLLASMATLPARQLPEPEQVRQRLQAYLLTYEEQLRTVVAEERLRQWPMRAMASDMMGATHTGAGRDSSRVRALVSEVAFVPLPGNAGWLGYRDVTQVGGKTVRRKGPSLVDLLKAQTDDARERAMVLLLESARHNLGAPRTINLPSLPLELLHARNSGRFAISQHDVDRLDGCPAMRLDLVETATPTLIQRPEGGNMPSRVTAWVDLETGRLCRAEVRTRDAQIGSNGIEAVVRVDFAHEAALDLWVPSRMFEVFLVPPRGRGEGEATYTNYRRFTTAGRLLPGTD